MRRRLDEPPRPRGRGPKGWRRPDERILDELCVTIAASGIDASEVEVMVAGGRVRLEGLVAHPADEAALLDLAHRVLGVTDVHAELRLRGHEDEEHEEHLDELEGPDPETRH